jgi:hypothetical protein
MSRGPGKLQKSIMLALQMSSKPLSAADLRFDYRWEVCLGEITAGQQRSIRMSVGRALRKLEAAGDIKRNKAGEWYPSKNWSGRDKAELERKRVAYHEAGHAVIGLALAGFPCSR